MLVVKFLSNTEKSQEENKMSPEIPLPQKMEISECSCYKSLNALINRVIPDKLFCHLLSH